MTSTENLRGWKNCWPPVLDPVPRHVARLVIVDGPDGVGKSTLCKNLQERLAESHIGRFGPAPDPLMIFEHYLRDLPLLGGRQAIADRFHPSSWAYGKVFRGGPDMPVETMHRFEDWLRIATNDHVFMVTVTSKKNWALENLKRSRPQTDEEALYEDPEKWVGVNDHSLEWHRRSTLRKVLIRMDEYTPEAAADTVMENLA